MFVGAFDFYAYIGSDSAELVGALGWEDDSTPTSKDCLNAGDHQNMPTVFG